MSKMKPVSKVQSDGGRTAYYDYPAGAREWVDLTLYKQMDSLRSGVMYSLLRIAGAVVNTSNTQIVPEGATWVQDTINVLNMGYNIGDAYCEIYRMNEASHINELRGWKKIHHCVNQEIVRVTLYEDHNPHPELYEVLSTCIEKIDSLSEEMKFL